jgi:hypothetical protein
LSKLCLSITLLTLATLPGFLPAGEPAHKHIIKKLMAHHQTKPVTSQKESQEKQQHQHNEQENEAKFSAVEVTNHSACHPSSRIGSFQKDPFISKGIIHEKEISGGKKHPDHQHKKREEPKPDRRKAGREAVRI